VRDEILEPVPDPRRPNADLYELSRAPIERESVRIFVAPTEQASQPQQESTWPEWKRIDRIDDADPDEPVFVVDSETGRLTFGNGVSGRRIPQGFRNVAATYTVPGGAGSKTPTGQRFDALPSIPGLASVESLQMSSGGVDPRPLDNGDRTSDLVVTRFGGNALRSQGRAVTAADIEQLALGAPGASVDAARAVPSSRLDGSPAPRTIAVYLLRRAVEQGAEPAADFDSTVAVERFLHSVAPTGARFEVGSPLFSPVNVSATVVSADRTDAGSVVVAVIAALDRYLDPIDGRDGRGWRPAATIPHREVAAIVAAVPGVARVESLTITPNQSQPPAPCDDGQLLPASLPVSRGHRIKVAVTT
jgi:predicted phage baseplate assembly protein